MRSNLYRTEVERMLERAKAGTRFGQNTRRDYARSAEDIVLLGDGSPRHDGRREAGTRRLREEWALLRGAAHDEKSRIGDLAQGERFGCRGVAVRRVRSQRGVWRPQVTPQRTKRTAVRRTLKEGFRRFPSQPVTRGIAPINPVRRGWVSACAIGPSSRGFSYVRDWGETKVRRHRMRARTRRGFRGKRWSRAWRYATQGLCTGDRVHYVEPSPTALPTGAVS